MNEVAREVLESLEKKLKSHVITIKLWLSSELPIIDGNVTQLRQVLSNLINNAIEAMASASTSSKCLRVITEHSCRDVIAVKVQDSGPGIHPVNWRIYSMRSLRPSHMERGWD